MTTQTQELAEAPGVLELADEYKECDTHAERALQIARRLIGFVSVRPPLQDPEVLHNTFREMVGCNCGAISVAETAQIA